MCSLPRAGAFWRLCGGERRRGAEWRENDGVVAFHEISVGKHIKKWANHFVSCVSFTALDADATQ